MKINWNVFRFRVLEMQTFWSDSTSSGENRWRDNFRFSRIPFSRISLWRRCCLSPLRDVWLGLRYVPFGGKEPRSKGTFTKKLHFLFPHHRHRRVVIASFCESCVKVFLHLFSFSFPSARPFISQSLTSCSFLWDVGGGESSCSLLVCLLSSFVKFLLRRRKKGRKGKLEEIQSPQFIPEIMNSAEKAKAIAYIDGVRGILLTLFNFN